MRHDYKSSDTDNNQVTDWTYPMRHDYKSSDTSSWGMSSLSPPFAPYIALRGLHRDMPEQKLDTRIGSSLPGRANDILAAGLDNDEETSADLLVRDGRCVADLPIRIIGPEPTQQSSKQHFRRSATR